MNSVFLELTAVLVMAGFIAVLVSFFKQPSIIAYIITGLIVGPLGYYHLQEYHVFDALGQIGITLLLFMVGLELDISQLKKIGRRALFTGIGQVVLTTAAGFLLLISLQASARTALFISLALTFSSTIIVIKLLGEKRDLQSLYGKLVVSTLVAQDLLAIVVLIVLAGLAPESDGLYRSLPMWQNILLMAIRGLILLLGISWLSSKIFPKILKIVGKSDELLLVFGLAWALGLAAFVSLPFMGFTLEIGGFLAGLALARSAVHYELSARIRSLRDFFVILFFIVLGSQLVLNSPGGILGPALALTLFVLVCKPLIIMLVMALLGFKTRTGFLAGVSLAQISEFSLILMALGYKVGLLNQHEVGVVTQVGMLSIAASSYMILYANQLYDMLRPVLSLFDFRRGIAEKGLAKLELKNHIVLVGAHRTGHHLAETLSKQDHPFVVVDFNPEIVERFIQAGTLAVCGDISDPYIQEQVNLDRAKLIVSTVSDHSDNLALIDSIRKSSAGRRVKPKLIFMAQDETEIKELYSQEIDYVISPHFMSGVHLSKILEDSSLRELKKLREKHLKIIHMKASGRD